MSAPDIVVKNIVIVGDGSVGKTCLLYAYSNQGEFCLTYIPTIYDRDETEIILDNQRHLIKLHDTAGQEDYERLRQIIYKEADCFILCYSIANRASFENIWGKWYPELKPFDCPIVLVGTKCDLSLGPNIVRLEEGERMRRKINANQFLECSAKENENINEVIYEAVRASVNGRLEDETGNDCRGCFNSARTSRFWQFLSSYCSCTDRK